MENYEPIEILLVEDNPDDAEMALKALKKEKIANNIKTIEDGEEALDFIFSKGKYADKPAKPYPKIILLDLKLPKVNGFEVLKAVKEDQNTQVIPVIIMTSSREEKDMIESYKLGVNSYIVKPVDFDKFVNAVRDLGLYWLLLNQQPF